MDSRRQPPEPETASWGRAFPCVEESDGLRAFPIGVLEWSGGEPRAGPASAAWEGVYLGAVAPGGDQMESGAWARGGLCGGWGVIGESVKDLNMKAPIIMRSIFCVSCSSSYF